MEQVRAMLLDDMGTGKALNIDGAIRQRCAAKTAVPKVIMFDLDGTLVDTMQLFADLAAELMEKVYSMPFANGRQHYLETSGIPYYQQLQVIQPGRIENAATVATFERRKRKICAQVPMDQRTLDTLRTLRNRGVRLVVSSNSGQEFVDAFVAREAFEFDLAMGFHRERGMCKGEPHISHTLATLQVNPGEVWFVGDSLKDGEMANRNGLRFIGRVGTFDAAAFRDAFPNSEVVDHVEGLLDLCC